MIKKFIFCLGCKITRWRKDIKASCTDNRND